MTLLMESVNKYQICWQKLKLAQFVEIKSSENKSVELNVNTVLLRTINSRRLSTTHYTLIQFVEYANKLHNFMIFRLQF